MRKRWEAVIIGVVWVVAAVVMAALGTVSLADLLPFAPVLTAADDGRINGSEWIDVLVTFVLAGVFIWRMARRRQKAVEPDAAAQEN